MYSHRPGVVKGKNSRGKEIKSTRKIPLVGNFSVDKFDFSPAGPRRLGF
jgi:hypothetical protein